MWFVPLYHSLQSQVAIAQSLNIVLLQILIYRDAEELMKYCQRHMHRGARKLYIASESAIISEATPPTMVKIVLLEAAAVTPPPSPTKIPASVISEYLGMQLFKVYSEQGEEEFCYALSLDYVSSCQHAMANGVKARIFLKNAIRAAVTYTKHTRRKTAMAMD
ncbi:unnamed protein product [Ilex paraguariensis]|uniref:Uncharacterized protein n=1 Tax=Ilex paraguariensis TaxID=185542 RepID=A0ABC8SEB5_9AQUA